MYVKLELLSLKNPEILNLNEVLAELAQAAKKSEKITLDLGAAIVELRPLCKEESCVLCIEALQGWGTLSKQSLFELVVQVLQAVVDALNNELLFDQDIVLGLSAQECFPSQVFYTSAYH